MLLHETVIEKLIRLCDNYGGHREQTKLRQEFRRIELAEYTQETGRMVLVLDEDLKKALREFDST